MPKNPNFHINKDNKGLVDINHCIVIGIDASNLRQGGGKTHLIELLRVASPQVHGITKVIVWGGRELLAALDDREWLEKVNPSKLDGNLFSRTLWQHFSLPRCARTAGCNLLFVPGGSYGGGFHPVVTMSRNMLPFEWQELKRYGFSLTAMRYLMLRWIQCRSFHRADGLIFLTEFAQKTVLKVTGNINNQQKIIPHGLSNRFRMEPKPQLAISEYNHGNPYKLLYVSIVNLYKHQWHVVEAVHLLRRQGMPVFLELIGPAQSQSLAHLKRKLVQVDPDGEWCLYHGELPYEKLHEKYREADLSIFASTCENMPNILLESMAAGLPVACSNRGPMPEVLGDGGVYFNPEQPKDIARALSHLINSPQLRTNKAINNYWKAKKYSWEKCSYETFAFLADIARQHQGL